MAVLETGGVLVAVDGSEESHKALRWALKNIVQQGDKFHLLYVQRPTTPYEPLDDRTQAFYTEEQAREDERERQLAHSRGILQAAVAICKEHMVPSEMDTITGDPREAICKAVEQILPRVLVMGARGFGPIKKFFLGSVSDYCVQHASCPVVVVRNT